MNLACFCGPQRRKNTRLRVSPPQEWGGLGGVDHMTITQSVQGYQDTRVLFARAIGDTLEANHAHRK